MMQVVMVVLVVISRIERGECFCMVGKERYLIFEMGGIVIVAYLFILWSEWS